MPKGKRSKPAPGRRPARERIFDSAARLFYSRGIRAVGVEAIAAQADTTKMGLYRNFPSKDELVAAWLRDTDAKFWRGWDRMAGRFPGDARRQILAAFALLERHVSDPQARGSAITNAAIEITEKDHPARRVSEDHKSKLRARLADLCVRAGARRPQLLADQLFLLMEGAHAATLTLGVRGPARNVMPAARALVDLEIGKGKKKKPSEDGF
jgi:AcrR family transcriptional regulator